MEIWDKNARKNNETTTQVLSTRWLQSRWNGSPRSDRVGMDQRWQLTNDVVHVLENFAFQVSSSWLIITISLFTIGYNFVKFFELTVIKVKTLRLLQKINPLLLRRPLMFMEAIPLPSPMAQSASQIWWSLFKKNANLFLQTISSQNHKIMYVNVFSGCHVYGYGKSTHLQQPTSTHSDSTGNLRPLIAKNEEGVSYARSSRRRWKYCSMGESSK